MKVLEFETQRDDLFAEGGYVVFVRVANLLDQAVNTKAFHGPRDLAAGSVLQPLTQIFVLKAADVVLPAAQRAEEVLVLGVEEVEASIAAFVL